MNAMMHYFRLRKRGISHRRACQMARISTVQLAAEISANVLAIPMFVAALYLFGIAAGA